MEYFVKCYSEHGDCVDNGNSIVFTANKTVDEAFFSASFFFPQWEDDCYIMMPACVYDGNKIKKIARKYPPMYKPEESGVDCIPMMTDVPGLLEDGSGEIQVTTGDMATPCVGIFYKEKKEGIFILTEQHLKGRNIGITCKRGEVTLSCPANRTRLYRFCQPHKTSGDKGIPVEAGEKIACKYEIHQFKCNDLAEFYKKYFEIRKSLMSAPRADFMYTKPLWDIMEKHFNEANFSGEFYAEASGVWQCGWVGGGMSTYPLLKYGNEESKARSCQTLDYLANHQAPSGFYYGIIRNGEISDDSFDMPGMENLHLIRKSGDILYFWFKNLSAVEPKQEWVDSARMCADAFVKLYRRYSTFGQFINVITGDMVVGCSASGAIVPAGLAKAWEYFGIEEYLLVAKESLEKYWGDFMKNGYTNGGPGEILSAPDSESAFALLESCVVLYEATGEDKWLEYAKTLAHFCSSWVVTYSYKFPDWTEFARLKINTVGSVFANVQNKHSAPGICTLSGDSIYKLYKYTGDEMYLNLIKDIAYFIPQCVSLNERPIYSWEKPPRALPEGYINERVNMSDWEDDIGLGGVFYGTCWPETSLTLSFTELMIHSEMVEK